jgi:cytochrome c oxidase subunit II
MEIGKAVKSNRIVTVIIIGVVLIAIGVFVGLTAQWMPIQASAESKSVDTLFNVMLAIATVVFLIVEGGIIYSIVRFRRRAGDDTDGPADHGNTALEITWTAIPAVIVFILTIYSYKVFSDIQAQQPDETVIGVHGQQFQWNFSYSYEKFTDLTDEQNQVAEANMNSNELHVPVGRPVRVEITSTDVMHGFYIPEFRIKQDAIPGHVTSTRFTPTLIGKYQVMCSELCGDGHAKMSTLSWVFVEDPADYDKFVAGLRNNAKLAATNPRRVERGKQLMVGKYPCGSCHTLTDAGLTGTIGPNLDGVGTRAFNNQDNRLAASAVPNAAEYLRLSITSPSAYLVPGYADLMPKNFGDPSVMPEDDREAIINYLLSLSPETKDLVQQPAQ